MLEREILCRMSNPDHKWAEGRLMSEFGRLVKGKKEMNADQAGLDLMEHMPHHGPNLFALQRSDNKMYVSVDEDGVLTCDAENQLSAKLSISIKDTRIACEAAMASGGLRSGTVAYLALLTRLTRPNFSNLCYDQRMPTISGGHSTRVHSANSSGCQQAASRGA